MLQGETDTIGNAGLGTGRALDSKLELKIFQYALSSLTNKLNIGFMRFCYAWARLYNFS